MDGAPLGEHFSFTMKPPKLLELNETVLILNGKF